MKATNGMTLKEVFLNTDYLETVVIIISKWAFLFFSLYPLVRKRRSSCRATRSWAARKRSGSSNSFPEEAARRSQAPGLSAGTKHPTSRPFQDSAALLPRRRIQTSVAKSRIAQSFAPIRRESLINVPRQTRSSLPVKERRHSTGSGS